MTNPTSRDSTRLARRPRVAGVRRSFFAVAALLALLAGKVAAADAPAHTNRLAGEKSPYLRQHAHNPVDWYPWGPEAFARARELNRPIFLSIGYSTCHWCHVMEHESFADPEIARRLNESFVCIKVDREERPDIDRVYMTFLQASTGGGGWPMSVWLTPDLKPFFGGTYFPPEDRSGLPGMKTLIARIAALWADRREQVLLQSDRMLAALRHDTRIAGTEDLPVTALRRRGLARLEENFDAENGGFEQAPKFPSPVTLEFLLDVAATSAAETEREPALRMAVHTLRRMAAGGVRDQVGGGFHRYAVDARWQVPHFEKMLYDQAQLVSVYLAAGQLAGDPDLLAVARDTLAYVKNGMMDPAGGFYSAEDADSGIAGDPAAKGEGAFYVWTAEEIAGVVGSDRAGLFGFVYGVQAAGNVSGPAGEEFAGRNILRREHTVAEAAATFGRTEESVVADLGLARRQLAAARAARPRPLRDDKVLTAWNGLMISAFARAAQVLGEPEHAVTAARAAAYLRANLFDATTGRLARSHRAGKRDEHGFAEDYAFLIQGLLDLYEADFDPRWLEWAGQLQAKQDELFWDEAAGGYFADAGHDESVLLRLKEDNDGAEPSPNSVAVHNLARLAAMLHREDWNERARRTARAFGHALERAPAGMARMLVSCGWLEGSPQQVLIQGEAAAPATRRLLAEVRGRYLPRKVVLLIDGASRPYLEQQVPFVAGLPANAEGESIAYVCENFTCQLPTDDPATFAAQLTRSKPPRATGQ